MTAIEPTAAPSLKAKLFAFVTGPSGQSLIRRVLSGSGVGGVWLIHHHFPEADLGPLSDIIIGVTPFVITEAWSQLSKTHEAIIGMAAKILAAKQSNGQPVGTIIVSKDASDGALRAVNNQDLQNVVPAGSLAAIKAAA